MNRNFTQFAFTDSVKKAQEHYGSRGTYARMEKAGDRYQLTDREAEFIRARDSFYMATVGENGWPYVQYRGGPKGFLYIIDDTTFAYADFRGNRQYISTGNLASNKKAALIFLDYPSRKRLKVWVHVNIIDALDDPKLLERLKMPDYKANIERLVIFEIQAFDWNCPQHITPRYTLEQFSELAIVEG